VAGGAAFGSLFTGADTGNRTLDTALNTLNSGPTSFMTPIFTMLTELFTGDKLAKIKEAENLNLDNIRERQKEFLGGDANFNFSPLGTHLDNNGRFTPIPQHNVGR
jgi:hypothetical protein